MRKLTVIIVNYNVKSFLKTALISIYKGLQGIKSQIIVVDNCSADGSIEMLKNEFPQVELIANDSNLGFSKANNLAIARSESEYICLINPDTLIRENVFHICLEFMDANPETGAAGGRITNPDGTLQLACRRSIPTPWIAFTKFSGLGRIFPHSKLFGKYNLTYLDENSISEVEALSGSFMFVRKKTIEDVGLLDENFFMYGEDLDWCLRIKQEGWKIHYLPAAEIIHYKGKSSQTRSLNSTFVFYNAMRIFVKKHFKQGWLWIPGWFLILGISLKGGFSFLFQHLKKTGLWFTDIVLLQIGLVAAIFTRFGHLQHWESYYFIDTIYTAIWMLVFASLGLYGKKILSHTRAFSGVIVGLIINSSLTFFFPQFAFSRQVIITATIFNIVLIAGWRSLFHSRFLDKLPLKMKKKFRKRTLLVGCEQSLKDFYNWNTRQEESKFYIAGFISKKFTKNDDIKKLHQLGSIQNIADIVKTFKIDEIIFPFENASEKIILTTLFACRSLPVQFKFTVDPDSEFWGLQPTDLIADLPLMDYNAAIYTDFNVYMKRLFDIMVSIMLLPKWLLEVLQNRVKASTKGGKIKISNGFETALDVSVYGECLNSGRGWKSSLFLIPQILKGNAAICGTPIVKFAPGKQGYGYKPGLTSILGRSYTEKDRQRVVFSYVNHYSLLLDCRLLIKMFKDQQ